MNPTLQLPQRPQRKADGQFDPAELERFLDNIITLLSNKQLDDYNDRGKVDGNEIYTIGTTPYAYGHFTEQTNISATVKAQITSLASRDITVSTSADTLTITKSGLYLINAFNRFGDSTASAFGSLICRLNSSTILYSWARTSAWGVAPIMGIRQLSEGDVIDFQLGCYGTAPLAYGGVTASQYSVVMIG